MSTLPLVELGVLGPLQVRKDGAPVIIPGAKPRAILTVLGLHRGAVVSSETLLALLWGDDPPRTADKALQTHISSLRRTLGDGVVVTEGAGWKLAGTEVDASRYNLAAKDGRDAAAAGDTSQAVVRFEEALALWRGIPELPDTQRGASEKTRWVEDHAALVEDRADALLATGRAAEIIGELEAAVGEAPLRERRWGQLMLALYRAGRQGEALGAYRRARSLLADELGVDPGPDLRRLETAIVAQDAALDTPVAQQLPAVTRAVTFLLTDIEGSTAAWEADSDAMAAALARHDELVEQVVTSRGGRLIKTRGEGDATFSVFERPSAAAFAAIELQDAIIHEPWALREPMRIRVALHTGEAELRDGDYFGRAVNRAARLRSLAAGGQIVCSGATAELVIDSLPDDAVLADLGMRQLKNLARPEHVFELSLESAEVRPQAQTSDEPIERPALPAVLAGPGPFVGRGRELEGLLSAWQTTLTAGVHAVLIAGEPGVGKTRLAGEWSRQAYEQGAVVIYGRCDEDLGAPYQPFAEALRSLVPCLGASRLQGIRGVEALLPLVPGLTDVLPDIAAPARADPDTERYALFDAVVALLGVASASAPVVLILDDLHWAAKPTLLLLRHLLRFGEHARVQIVGTYRSTDLDRSHPLAAMLADLHRDGTASRIQLSGLDENDVTAYVAEAGYDDEELARALASVTGGNPFFLIEALRHVGESGGRWDPSTLPQGVREAVSRRLSRLPAETNKALAAAAVVGSRFALDLVERVVDQDLVDAFDEACKAGIVIEEPGGRYRFNHAIVRQSLLAELASVRRMRLHQRIATTLESEPGADDELLAELAYHYFECAWAGNAAKAVEYCRRAADQAMARLAYEGAAELYDRALHALEELDEELPDRDDQTAELLVARCEALLAAGDVTSAASTVAQLQDATRDSARLAAWATCFDGQLSMLIDPERLDELESAVGAAADKLAELGDAAGEAKAHTVRATCLGRLGRIGDCEIALDNALTAARRAREHRRVNEVLAGAPLAALWGPNPVPRAGGRCLDVVRLLRITTDSPAVEATSTRCQAVLEAFRGRAAAARRMIDSARRTVTELGLRHALLEVEQFAGIVELVVDDPGAAEPHLRKAYKGFRRMGLDADTAETAALLGRACLALDRDAEADELCSESERLAGHALKPSIAWRTLRAQLLSRRNVQGEARRVAEAAVNLAERTDLLVDHGDACLALATVLGAVGDTVGARTAAERAVGLYELKGAAALAEKARRVLGEDRRAAPALPEAPQVELDNACVRAIRHLDAAFNREAWDEVEQLLAPVIVTENRRKIVGHPPLDLPSNEWAREGKRYRELGQVRHRHVFVAAQGERLCLTRWEIGIADLSPGAPRDEMLQLFGLDEDGRIALQVWFDIEDLDAALAELDAAHARFEEERRRAPLENAASRADDRLITLFGDNRLDEIGALFTEDTRLDDRRQGLRRESSDRATAVENVRAIAAVGVVITKTTLALRGDRLYLSHIGFEEHDTRPAAFRVETLEITEVTTDGLIVAKVVFDPDDIDAAIAELDARYLAGDAVAHAHTWSVVSEAYAALNRHEIAPTTPDAVNIDHRRGRAFAPGDLPAYLRATWELTPQARIDIETVHRLSNLGAVVTQASHGTSQEGFDAEWREIAVVTVEGDLMSRVELFDEADLEAALAHFDELDRPARRLENLASRVVELYLAHFTTRDWSVMSEMLDGDFSGDDRRRVVNAGIRQGRDAEIANLQVIAELGCANIPSAPIATRGERLVLTHDSFITVRDESAENETIDVVEINADNRIAAVVSFDLDDIDSAFAELDARYLAGEAAKYARTWSVIAGAVVAHNRRALPATPPDLVSIDHRRVAAFAPGEALEYIRAGWDLSQDRNLYVETVHRVSDLGAIFTWTAHGTSRDGFDAEWRSVGLMTVEGEMVNRAELFDETDIDAAIARFEQLSRPAPGLENMASRVTTRFLERFGVRDWDAMAQMVINDVSFDDRRHVVNADLQIGRDLFIENFRTAADLGATQTVNAIATRGDRLVLTRARFSRSDGEPEEFGLDLLHVIEIDADNRIAAAVTFDSDDFAAAFEELDARYLAGEAAPYGRTWRGVMDALGELNRHEPGPMIRGLAYADRRRVPFASGEDFGRAVEELWALVPDARYRVTAVNALDAHGTVASLVIKGTDAHGNELQWARIISFVSGESRLEVYEEEDLDEALARFDQLSRPARRLDNAATRVYERLRASFTSRDWTAMAEILADETSLDDRRRTVNGGVLQGRDVNIAEMRAIADVGVTNVTWTVLATRGEHLALIHVRFSGQDQRTELFHVDVVDIVEVDTNDRIAARVAFDLDDTDAAFEELDARYLAGEAAAHAHTWSLIAQTYAGFNRGELPATTQDWVNVDHRHVTAMAPGEGMAYFRASWELAADLSVHIEAVHRLSDLGAVFTHTGNGTSQEGFDAEWRAIDIMTVEGDLINRVELFDEAGVDAAIARFEELSRPAPRLENAATRVYERLQAYFLARDWEALTETLADDHHGDDRRRVVNAGIRHGRDAEIASMRATAEVGVASVTSVGIATRGDRLALCRIRGATSGPEAFDTELLRVLEIDADDRIATRVVFDLDDIDAAIAELDARYLAGEAAAHAHTWSVITAGFAALNRHELPPTTPDCVSIDHRRGTAFAPGELIAYVRAGWDLDQDIRTYVEVVHRLSDLGAVVTHAAYGTSKEGFRAEWRGVDILTVDGNMVSRSEVFDEADLDAALTRFEELHPHAPRLENAASRVDDRFEACFEVRDWDAMAQLMADDISIDDRRHVVNAGLRCGRDVEIANMRARASVGVATVTSTVIATRGERLALSRNRFFGRDQRPGAFHTEALCIIEIDTDGRILARVGFDLNDIEAAFEELDARYLAGEAAAHSHTWSVIAQTYAALNRHELPPTSPDWVNIDHRRVTTTAAGDLIPSLRVTWDLMPNFAIHIETVHRLTDFGAAFTNAAHGTSQEGADAEWREIAVMSVEGDLINQCELFDDADIDAALTCFEGLQPQPRRLENAANQVAERYLTHFAARDWDAMATILADDFLSDDRRRVVGAGVRHGPDAEIADMRAIADLLGTDVTATAIATRGARLILSRARFSGGDRGPEKFHTEVLSLVEIDADHRIKATVQFDVGDIDAAFDELDVRYLAGEATPHARVWQLGMNTIGELNRHEPGPMLGRLVYADHRRVPFASGEDFRRGVEELWALVPNARYRVKAMHALDAHGTVVTLVIEGTDAHGNELQWARTLLFASNLSRLEVYEEDDVDAALARFEELHPQRRRLENAASQVAERYQACFAARDWAAMAELVADDIVADDRRRVVNAGVRHGRDVHIADTRTAAELGAENIRSSFIATRGKRLALAHVHSFNRGFPGEFGAEMLAIVELDTDNRIAATVAFDLDDVDAAFEELDARYLAGEATAHAHTWSAITQAYAALNRRQLPATTPDWVNIDHRRFATIEPNALTANIRAYWDLTSEARIDIEAVHRLSNLGAVVTHATHATAQEGLEIESSEISILMVEGELLNRCEIFDEADVDAALARFDELDRAAPRLENAASRVEERARAYFAARDWDAMAEILAEDICHDDRRRVVNTGLRQDRDVAIANMRATADIGTQNVASTVIATRGERLTLSRVLLSGRDQRPEAFHTEFLSIGEINADNRIAAIIVFDPDDIDAAFEELDARYLAGEAAAHAHTWPVITGGYAAFNRHEVPATTPDWVNIDHRRAIAFTPGELIPYIHATWDVAPDISIYIEAVHELSDLGAVVTQVTNGTSQEGFDAEWQEIALFTVEGDLINRIEIFDQADIDAALARFDELSRPAPRLENAASQADDRFWAAFAAHDWVAIGQTLATDISTDDRRHVVNSGVRRGRDAVVAEAQSIAVFVASVESDVVAIRGERLVLRRYRLWVRDQQPEAFHAEVLGVIEINAENQFAMRVVFDPEDLDAAFQELDSRYLAGEAATHARTWSLIAETYAALNRHELPPTTPDWVNVDHRRVTTTAAGDLIPSLRATWDLMPNFAIHVETVHRLTDFGAAFTYAAHGTSQEGLDAEWREIAVLSLEGERINHWELFDETDIDAALVKFDELSRPLPRVENAASQVSERFLAYFAARDWDAMAAMLADNICSDDRRRVVGAGIHHGRDARISELRVMADLGATSIASTILATRGESLALARTRARYSDREQAPEAFQIDVLHIMEIDASESIAAAVVFDHHDLDAAFEELDSRYVAGEAGAHAPKWSVIAGVYAAFNRGELPAADWINVDHRRGTPFAPTDLTPAIRAWRELTPNCTIQIEAVHRLSDLGAVVTSTSHGTSAEGFDAEWRMIQLLTVEGDRVSRCEFFDESDLDAALARLHELSRHAPSLVNAATRTWARFADAFNRRDVEGFLALMAAEGRLDDRRKGLSDLVDGPARRKAVHAVFEAAPESWRLTVEPIAIRGSRLSLTRERYRDTNEADQPITVEHLTVTEVDADGLVRISVLFDPDDINGAFAELTARWIASGEVEHPEVIETVCRLVDAANRHDWDAVAAANDDATYVSHRQLTRSIADTIADYLSSFPIMASLVPDLRFEFAEVLANSATGLVAHMVLKGTSTDGVAIELGIVQLTLVEGDRITHIETFDPDERDLALARFEELSQSG